MDDYNLNSLTPLDWPQLNQADNGTWIRVWDIVLVDEAISEGSITKLEEELSNEEITISVEVICKVLKITVKTLRWGWEDDLIGYSYKILKGVNDIIGEINTIQGQEREVWPPWAWEKD